MSDVKASKPMQMALNWEAGVKPQGPGARGDSVTATFPSEHPMVGANFTNHLTWPNRPGTDPYAGWCGRREVARLPPIPIA